MCFRGVREFGLLLAGGRFRLTLGVAVVSLAVVGIVAGPALAKTKSFTSAGCSTWAVPAGVSSVSMQATGSAGETVNGVSAPGGSGDVVSGVLSGLSAGQMLDVCVGVGGGAGGAGGGQTGGAGGGASGAALGSDFSTPVLVAGGGGGGGGGSSCGGGSAGLPAAATGGGFLTGCSHAGGGGGGDNTAMAVGAGGAADAACGSCSGGQDGFQFSGTGPGSGGSGGGGSTVFDGDGGGGGGAGYYGGGGGGGAQPAAAAGGGGSDFCASSLTGASLSGCAVTGSNSAFGTASVVLTFTQAAWAHDFRDLLVDSRGVGPGETLVHKVKLARSKYMAGDVSGACRTLDGYIREVDRQTGATISQAQARDLIEDAHETQKAIGCSSR